jgi:hypothetical protein
VPLGPLLSPDLDLMTQKEPETIPSLFPRAQAHFPGLIRRREMLHAIRRASTGVSPEPLLIITVMLCPSRICISACPAKARTPPAGTELKLPARFRVVVVNFLSRTANTSNMG